MTEKRETARAREILSETGNPKEETEAEQSATESADKPILKRGRSPGKRDRQSPCRGARQTTRSTSQSKKIQKLREESAQTHTIPPEEGEKAGLESIPKSNNFDADSDGEDRRRNSRTCFRTHRMANHRLIQTSLMITFSFDTVAMFTRRTRFLDQNGFSLMLRHNERQLTSWLHSRKSFVTTVEIGGQRCSIRTFSMNS